MPHPLESLLSYARRLAGDNQQLASVVIKELLHYDILHALSQTPLVDALVFQRGTALRLCYGGTRYSEDLDFVCPEELPARHLANEKFVIQFFETAEQFLRAIEPA